MERREKLQFILMILFLVIIVGTICYIVFNKPKEIVHPKVTMKIKDKGEIVIELYPEKAPNTALACGQIRPCKLNLNME